MDNLVNEGDGSNAVKNCDNCPMLQYDRDLFL